ncbi:MAG: ABC transporter permease [Parvibaculaceae bacterium]
MMLDRAEPVAGMNARLTAGRLAMIIVAVGAFSILAAPYLPWIVKWPDAWALPATRWIGAGVSWLVTGIKPAARVVTAVLAFPMAWSNALLTQVPWPIVIGTVTGLAWYQGGIRMAALAGLGFGFVLASGYWLQGMNTLSLVAVSVPLALLVGAMIGILAHESQRLRPAIQTTLDVMQTVPTFAYLTPLLFLFGFGPVVGLVASAIYAVPPMARNMVLGLERVEPEIREAAVMSGGNRWQQLVLVEIPAAAPQILVGVNQCLMASLSMVIIAAVIGGFNDIGWEVLMTMRKAEFGKSLLAGSVIVVFAIVIDRMSSAGSAGRSGHSLYVAWGIPALAVIATALFWDRLPDPRGFALFHGLTQDIDARLAQFTASNGALLDQFKNGAMFYVLLPLRIGLDNAVLPLTWGFQWTPAMSIALYAVTAAVAGALAWQDRPAAGCLLLIGVGVLETGIAQLPWPVVLSGAAALGWLSGGRRLAVVAVILLGLILVSGLWDRALLSLYLTGAAVMVCIAVGGAIGILSFLSPLLWRLVQPVCDMLQTIPLFVFLIPVLMFFQIGEFSAFVAICAYAVVPMIRYTRHGLDTTPEELLEAAVASGATPLQTLLEVRFPYAAPTILLGLNQTINYAFAMLVIAALVGTTELGQSIFLALGQADVGLGIAAGAAMAMLALVADRLVQGFANERRKALGLSM